MGVGDLGFRMLLQKRVYTMGEKGKPCGKGDARV